LSDYKLEGFPFVGEALCCYNGSGGTMNQDEWLVLITMGVVILVMVLGLGLSILGAIKTKPPQDKR
jgi:hypothetical protein